MHESNVEMERIRLLYGQAPRGIVVALVSTIAIASFFWLEGCKTTQEVVALWFLAAIVIVLVRAFVIWRFNKLDLRGFDYQYWANLFTIGIGFSGLLMGSASILFLDFAQPYAALFLTLIMFGNLAGTLAALSHHCSAYLLYSILSMLPLTILFYLQGGAMVAISVLLVVFVAAYFFYAKSLCRATTRSIEQRFENAALLEQLKYETAVAEQANADKSRLLAATSHDLRQPLHSLSLFLAVLKEKLTTEEQLHLMRQTERSRRVLSDQLNGIIEITQIDSGALKVKSHSVSIKQVVEEVVSEFSLLAEEVGVDIRLRLKTLWVETDSVLLARIVRNLISNAVEHCPGSSLLIAAKKISSNRIQLLLMDSGPGIAEAETENIFSEFYQLNNPERDRNKGLGLGLSIVKRLSVALDISVNLTSEVGKGTAFRLSLPMCPQERDDGYLDKSLPQKASDTAFVAGLFIVLVDDEAKNLAAMKNLFLQWHAEVLTATNHIDLMHELQKHPYAKPDLLLMDYRLSGSLTGYDLIMKVREHFADYIPASLVTGDATMNLKKEFEDCDVSVEYKPISAVELLSLVDRLLNKG